MRILLPWININGTVRQNKNILSEIENGMFGPGVFTTLKIKNMAPLFLEMHYQRLFNNYFFLTEQRAELDSALTEEIQKIIKKNNMTDGAIRITLTKFENNPFFIIHATTLENMHDPIKVITIPDDRKKDKVIKSIERKKNKKALQNAQEKNAQDALFVKNNNIIESTSANIFALDEENNIITPQIKNNGLNGIMRQIILSKLKIQEKNISMTTKQPMILVNSLGIKVIKQIDKINIPINKSFIAKITEVIQYAENTYHR